MASRLATDAAAVRGAVGDQLGLLVQNLVTMVAGFAVAFAYGWKMTLVVLSVVPLMGAAGYFQVAVTTGNAPPPSGWVFQCKQLPRHDVEFASQHLHFGRLASCRRCSWWASARMQTSCSPMRIRQRLRHSTTSERCGTHIVTSCCPCLLVAVPTIQPVLPAASASTQCPPFSNHRKHAASAAAAA